MPRLALLFALATLIGACDRSDVETREWRATDHSNPSRSAGAHPEPHGPAPHSPSPTPPAASGNGPTPAARTAMSDWSRLCVRCHGRIGRGDGPMGKPLGAPNLTDPEWQTATSDARIRASIQKGRGQMPAFDLPGSTLDGLVGLIRMMRTEPEGVEP